MARLKIAYPSSLGTPTPFSNLIQGDIFEWNHEFWIMTDEKSFVSLTCGTLVPMTEIHETEEYCGREEFATLLNNARLYPYGD